MDAQTKVYILFACIGFALGLLAGFIWGAAYMSGRKITS